MIRTCEHFNDDLNMTIELPAYFYRNCALKYKCKANWESMEKADDEDYELVRTCSECNEKVHLAEDDVSMRFHVESNNCIVIPLELTEYYPYIEEPLFTHIIYCFEKLRKNINNYGLLFVVRYYYVQLQTSSKSETADTEELKKRNSIKRVG